jgi:hypothetical protein
MGKEMAQVRKLIRQVWFNCMAYKFSPRTPHSPPFARRNDIVFYLSWGGAFVVFIKGGKPPR